VIYRVLARESTTGVWVQPAMGAGGIWPQRPGREWGLGRREEGRGRRGKKGREKRHGGKDIPNRTTHSYGSMDLFSMRGMEGMGKRLQEAYVGILSV
jgi:hypothetical protein